MMTAVTGLPQIPDQRHTWQRHGWMIAPLSLAAACAALALLVSPHDWAVALAHPGRQRTEAEALAAIGFVRPLLAAAAAALVAFTVMMSRRQDPDSTPAPSDDEFPHESWWLLGLLVLGIVLAVLRMGESLWYDEIAVWREVGQNGPGAIVGNYVYPGNQILHTLLSWLAVDTFAASVGFETAYRLPAFGFYLGAIAGVYATMKVAEGGGRLALLAAGVFTILPVNVLEAVEARAYSMMICFSAWATCALLGAVRDPRPWRWFLYAVVCGLGAWAHFVMVMVPAGHLLWLVWRRVRGGDTATLVAGTAAMALAGALAMLLYAPVLPELINMRSHFTAAGGDEPGVFGVEGWYALLQLGGAWSWWTVPGLILFAAGLAAAWRDARWRSPVGALMAGLPIMLGIVLVANSWMYARFCLFVIPGVAIVMALGIDRLRQARPPLAWGAGAVLVAACVGDLITRPPKQPLRDAVAHVSAHRQSGELLLAVGLRHQVLELYTPPEGIMFFTPPLGAPGAQTLGEFLDDLRPAWVILLYEHFQVAERRDAIEEAGYALNRRLDGWVDWTNGDVLVYRREN